MTPDGEVPEELSPGFLDSRRRLSPMFVNWLQGNPCWWTHPEPINCAASETCAWRRALRSLLWGLLGG
jgi:hypothetical protein